MTVFEFEEVLNNACTIIKYATNVGKATMAMFMYSLCTNSFEEQCVIERIRELRP